VRAARFVGDVLPVLFSAIAVLSVLRLLLLLAVARRHSRRARLAPEQSKVPLPGVSIVVPAYNEEKGNVAAVQSLASSDYPLHEVIVVDDGSTDATADKVAALHLPSVRLIRQPNAGKPAALNAGIRAARHDILVLVDGDTVFERDALRALVAPFTDRMVGAVSGNPKVGNRRRLLGRWQHIEYVIGANLDRRFHDVFHCMPTVPGAIGAFRRTALTDVGGVPDDTLAEDTDLTMALCRSPWRVVYAPNAIAWTEAPSGLRQLWRQRYRWSYGTMQAMWKHRRAVIEHGASGRFGRYCLTYLTLFHILLPLIAPVVDVFSIYGLVFLNPVRVTLFWLTFVLLQALAGGYALWLDGERLRSLRILPLQQVVYRQLMYLVTIQSVITALAGTRQRWQAISRTGVFAEPAGGGS
jgi:cellulose synthase/poly-beta-1,6-N-acetylglucosamine synthase-like glycosyltransferase